MLPLLILIIQTFKKGIELVLCVDDPMKIRQSQNINNYYICSGEFDELRPYRILIKEMSIESIERWTHKKIKSIVFDSDIDNWNSGREFSEYIIGKSNLLFMIDDVENNRFGGYISSQITNSDIYINDSNAFIFSLKSNGRLNQPMKFPISSSQYVLLQLQHMIDIYVLLEGI